MVRTDRIKKHFVDPKKGLVKAVDGVSITGAGMSANNGLFPIVARPAANTIVYANPAARAETLPAAATHVNLAGRIG